MPVLLCQYCGSIADQRDHLKPRQGKLAFGMLENDYSYIKTVFCCHDCNHKLRGCLATDFRGRAAFLYFEYGPSISEERSTWIRAMALID